MTTPATSGRRPRRPLGAPVPYPVLQTIRAKVAAGVPDVRVASTHRVALAVVRWAALGVETLAGRTWT